MNNLKYEIIINPVAGKQNIKKTYKIIDDIFDANGVSYNIYVTERPGDAIEKCRKIAKGTDAVIAVGGDGTVNEVVNGLVGTNTLFGVIPVGTGNDFARSINLSLNLKQACEQILAGKTKFIDLGKVCNRYFINLVGVGFDGAVAYQTNQHNKYISGKWMYLLSVLKTLMNYKPVEMKITLDSDIVQCSPMLVAVGIGPSYGGGIKIVPDAVQNDGYFDICFIRSLNKASALYYLKKALNGKHSNLNKVTICRSNYVKLESKKPLPYHVEGEVFFSNNIEFTLQRQAIQVITG